MSEHVAGRHATLTVERLRRSLVAAFEDFVRRVDADTLAAAAALHPEAPRTAMPLDVARRR